MPIAIAAAAVLSLGLLPARVTTPLGRAPKTPEHGLKVPKLWQDRTGQFALERPGNERWMFRAGVRGPDGEMVPLLALSQETGAQLVVQSADGINDLKMLARMLMENLSNEQRVHVEDVERLLARGGRAVPRRRGRPGGRAPARRRRGRARASGRSSPVASSPGCGRAT